MKTKIKYNILKQAYDYVFGDLEVDEFYPVLDLQEEIEAWYDLLHREKYGKIQHYFSHSRRIGIKRNWALERGWDRKVKKVPLFLNETTYLRHTTGYIWVGLK
tara:strand:- start:8532 stop:8840 length:309 start_codon:yes stop_codon:yes gene_type:complete